MAWPSVRVAVLEGLTLLVDNPHAQPVLKRALPQLAALLGDPALRVGTWGGLGSARVRRQQSVQLQTQA